NKLGWCKSIQYSQKKRPMHIARGSYRIAQCTSHPELVALSWMDSRPVNMLATGCGTRPTSVHRTEKNGSRSVVPCPTLVTDYLSEMGGSGRARSDQTANILYSKVGGVEEVLQAAFPWLSGYGHNERIYCSQNHTEAKRRKTNYSREVHAPSP
ncbi:hypothetical protein L917_21663, partial [Phytophthora nicotianae]